MGEVYNEKLAIQQERKAKSSYFSSFLGFSLSSVIPIL